MENPQLNLLASPNGLGRLPWKTIGLALLLLVAGLLLLYLLSVRANRTLKRRILGLADEIDALQGLLDAGTADLDVTKPDNTPDAPEPVAVQPPPGFRMPILNPGLKFNLQPEFSLPYPAFHAWNTGGTLRVFVLFDLSAPAWTFKLYSTDGALLKESNIPIEGAAPDGKRIATEIRSLLEENLDANSA